MPLLGKPDHIQAFTAERDKHPAPLGTIGTGPESGKQRVHRLLVKIGSPVSPKLQPEMIVATGHDDPGNGTFFWERIVRRGKDGSNE